MKYIKSFEQFVNEKNENQEFFDQIDAISEELGDDQLNEVVVAPMTPGLANALKSMAVSMGLPPWFAAFIYIGFYAVPLGLLWLIPQLHEKIQEWKRTFRKWRKAQDIDPEEIKAMIEDIYTRYDQLSSGKKNMLKSLFNRFDKGYQDGQFTIKKTEMLDLKNEIERKRWEYWATTDAGVVLDQMEPGQLVNIEWEDGKIETYRKERHSKHLNHQFVKVRWDKKQGGYIRYKSSPGNRSTSLGRGAAVGLKNATVIPDTLVSEMVDWLATVNEARGFTIRELRLKALDLLRGLGIKNPSDKDISDMIETIKTFIKGHNLGVVMG